MGDINGKDELCFKSLGDFCDATWQQTYQVNPLFLVMCERSQNYINNGHLPGKSVTTQCSKVSHC